MSGSGGGGGRNSPPPSDSRDCEKLVTVTVLNSPVPKVVAKLKKDDRLDVVEKKTVGISRLEAVDENGKTAGSLTPNNLVEIVNCIEAGHDYVAIVLADPEGGSVKVRIQSKKKKP